MLDVHSDHTLLDRSQQCNVTSVRAVVIAEDEAYGLFICSSSTKLVI
jgi:hypothetical protein